MNQLIEGNGSITAVDEIEGVTVFVSDSIAFASRAQEGQIVVTGSHGGRSAGEYASSYRFGALVANDAGRGLNDAGVAGLAALDEESVPGVGVSHTSARIGDGTDIWESGVVSYVNEAAAASGAALGQSTREAVRAIAGALAAGASPVAAAPARHEVA